MSDEDKIYLKYWNTESRMTELTGEVVSIDAIACSMTLLNFAKILDNYLYLNVKSFHDGKLVGLHLRNSKRLLQRFAISFALGMIVGLSEQEHFDFYNAEAIKTAKKLAQMIKFGRLPLI